MSPRAKKPARPRRAARAKNPSPPVGERAPGASDVAIGTFGDPIVGHWNNGALEMVTLETRDKKLIARAVDGLLAGPTAQSINHIGVKNAADVDFQRIAMFPALRSLSIGSGLADGAKLALPALRALSIGNANHLAKTFRSLESLHGLGALENLSIQGSGITSLKGLSQLPALRALALPQAKALTDLTGIEALESLAELDVNLTPLASLAPLAALRGLTSIKLRGTRIKDLSPLWAHPDLAEIYAEKTPVASLAGIEHLLKLRLLWIFDTKVRDLAPLRGLPALQTLNIAGLRDYENGDAVGTLAALKTLDVYGCEPPFDPEWVGDLQLDEVRGCAYPPPTRAARNPLAWSAAPVARTGVPDEIRSVTAHGQISQIALSDDGELIAIASMSADRKAPTLAVHRTRDATEVCAYTVETIAGNGKAACFDAAGDLLFVAGDSLFRLKIGDAPQKLGRLDCESMFRDAAGKRLALVERGGAVRFVSADAPLGEGWRHDAGRGHMLFGTQVRFVGDTPRALIGALADHGPLLVDVTEKTVLREYPRKSACADANDAGDLLAVFEPRSSREDWLSVYRGEDADPTSVASEALFTHSQIAFAPDGQQLVKASYNVQLVDVATGAASDARAANALPGSTHTQPLRARHAPLIAWSSFNFRMGDFRAYWASFSTGA
jgi:hypothetical protein